MARRERGGKGGRRGAGVLVNHCCVHEGVIFHDYINFALFY